MAADSKPLIGIPASFMTVSERRHPAHGTGAKNVDAVVRFTGGVPMLIPAIGGLIDIDDMVARLDGLLLTGGRANVEPHHYEGPPFPEDEPIDPGRDSLVLPLVRACIEAGVPVFGICRGIQELNVALGGSLHYRVHTLPGRQDHRMPRHPDVTVEEIFKLRHDIHLTPGGYLAGRAGCECLMVNSLHGQAVDRLASDLCLEAISPDDVIEAVRLKGDPGFTVGVQWHAEWRPEEHALSRALFEDFSAVAWRRAGRRGSDRSVAA